MHHHPKLYHGGSSSYEAAQVSLSWRVLNGGTLSAPLYLLYYLDGKLVTGNGIGTQALIEDLSAN